MPTRRRNTRSRRKISPKTQWEAMNIIILAWLFLLKRNPAVFIPLTLWLLFGGFVYFYNYSSANKVEVTDITPPVSSKVDLSITPQAFAGDRSPTIDPNYTAFVTTTGDIMVVENKTHRAKLFRMDIPVQNSFRK